MPITKEDRREWLSHSCTKELLSQLDADKELFTSYALEYATQGDTIKSTSYGARATLLRSMVESIRDGAQAVQPEENPDGSD